MPRGYLMTWDAGHRRWQKMFKEQWYRVTSLTTGSCPRANGARRGATRLPTNGWEEASWLHCEPPGSLLTRMRTRLMSWRNESRRQRALGLPRKPRK